jgi:hypothetical protein
MTFDLLNCEIFLPTFHQYLHLSFSTLLLTYVVNVLYFFSKFCKNSKKKIVEHFWVLIIVIYCNLSSTIVRVRDNESLISSEKLNIFSSIIVIYCKLSSIIVRV